MATLTRKVSIGLVLGLLQHATSALAAPSLTLTDAGFQTVGLYDDYGNPYPTIYQWSSTGGNGPAAVIANQYVITHVRFAISGADRAYNATFWGESGTRSFPAGPFVIDAGATQIGLENTTSQPTPNYPGYADPWTVTWKYSVEGGPTKTAGVCKIQTYLLLDYPLWWTQLYPSVVHHACATAGGRTQDQVVAKSPSE